MQNTVNLDLNNFYDDIMSGLNIAFGAEYRLENYQIVSGEEASYAQYTASGQVITLATQDPARDFLELPDREDLKYFRASVQIMNCQEVEVV